MRHICTCGRPAEYNDAMAGTEYTCPDCETVVLLPSPKTDAKPPQISTAPPLFIDRAALKAALLEKVRGESCYRTLRRVIDWTTNLQIIGVVVGAVFQVIFNPTDSTALTLAALFLSPLAIALIIAGRQASIVVVDLVDLQIHAQMKK